MSSPAGVQISPSEQKDLDKVSFLITLIYTFFKSIKITIIKIEYKYYIVAKVKLTYSISRSD